MSMSYNVCVAMLTHSQQQQQQHLYIDSSNADANQ